MYFDKNKIKKNSEGNQNKQSNNKNYSNLFGKFYAILIWQL